MQLEKMYRVGPTVGEHTLCKVRQYGQIWCKPMPGRITLGYSPGAGVVLIERYDANQVALVVANDGATECYQVLVAGEVLTMHGRSWRSMVEVKQ